MNSTKDGVAILRDQIADELARLQDNTRKKQEADNPTEVLDAERIKRYIVNACKTFNLDYSNAGHFPRNYTMALYGKTSSEARFFIEQKDGSAEPVTDMQFALDIATGWLGEFNTMLEALLDASPASKEVVP